MLITRNPNKKGHVYCVPCEAQKDHRNTAEFNRRLPAFAEPLSYANAFRNALDVAFKYRTGIGGYSLMYFSPMQEILCANCACQVFLDEREEITVSTYDEGPMLYCEECNVPIESSYGDPEEEETPA